MRVGAPLGALARGTNKLTWAIDDAAKQAVLKRKLARGMDPNAAAAETLREMVDYRHRSKATEALGLVAPFATFRSRIPAAVASSASRNPGRLLALDRAAQSYFSNGRVGTNDDDGKQRTLTMTQPISDVVGLGDEPQKYARAMLADPIKALLSPIDMSTTSYDRTTGENKTRERQHYFTNGMPLQPHQDREGKMKAGFLAQQLAGYAPFGTGEALLNATGTNEYPSENWLSSLIGCILGTHIR